MKNIEFYTCFLQAWRASLTKVSLPWFFAALIAFASITEARLTTLFPASTTPTNVIKLASEMNPEQWANIFLGLVVLFLLKAFGKSNLIVSLASVAGKTGLPNFPTTKQAVTTNFSRGLLVESLVLVIFLITISLLLLPAWIASARNPETTPLLIGLAILTLLPIGIIILLFRQYALFYFLLTPLRLRSAIEVSASLLSRVFFQSIGFGLFAVSLVLLFTFAMDVAILSVSTVLSQLGTRAVTIVSFILNFIFFAWLAIFLQALWLSFFKSLVGTHPSPKTRQDKKDKKIELTDTLPETPPAQSQ